jgi:diamine N-acetyltransferase
MVSILDADESFCKVIREMALKIWIPTYTPILGSKQVGYMLERFYSLRSLKEQMSFGQKFLIFTKGGYPAGFVSYSTGTDNNAKTRKIHKLYILPQYQGMGIGNYILAYVAAPHFALELNVNRYNTPAINFYKKNNFAIVKEEDIDIGEGYYMNDYVMHRPC